MTNHDDMPTYESVLDAYQQRSVLVTGGAGFIGSHLTRGLVRAGARVTVLDDLSHGHRENLTEVETDINFIQASITDPDAIASAIDGCEIVFHEAALASVPESIERVGDFHEVNTNGTFNVLEAARTHGVKRVVFASSSSGYGDQPELPKHEEMVPDCLSPYAQQKLAGEYMLRAWALSYGISTVSLRYFNIFGPGQRADSAYAAVVAAFAKALLNGNRPKIFGDGSASRDFTYIDNVVQANLRAGMLCLDEQPKDPEIAARFHGGVVNVACGRQTTVRELAETMAASIGRDDLQPEFMPPRAGDVQHSLADITRARTWLGYEPTVGLREGLDATMAWYQAMEKATS